MPISERALTLSGYFEYKETEPSISLPPCENVINLHKGQSTATEFIFTVRLCNYAKFGSAHRDYHGGR